MFQIGDKVRVAINVDHVIEGEVTTVTDEYVFVDGAPYSPREVAWIPETKKTFDSPGMLKVIQPNGDVDYIEGFPTEMPDDDSQFTQLPPSEHGLANTNEKVPVEEKFDIAQSDNVEVLRTQAKYHLEQSLACLERIDELEENDDN